MTCDICGQQGELATKTIGRGAGGIIRCHRLACGHAWHVTSDPAARPDSPSALPTRCSCGEIAAVNALLVEGKHHERLGVALVEDAFRAWSHQVLEALDGIPAESGAPSLARSAATAVKSSSKSLIQKTTSLNALLASAVKAVS